LSSNLTFWGLIWPLRGLTQKCEGTAVGAGSPWLCTWPPRSTSPPSLCIQIHTFYLWTLSPHSTPTSIIHGFALQPYTCKFFGKGRGRTDSMNSISKLLHFATWVVFLTSNIPYVTLLSWALFFHSLVKTTLSKFCNVHSFYESETWTATMMHYLYHSDNLLQGKILTWNNTLLPQHSPHSKTCL
jgi:hypothetical protein